MAEARTIIIDRPALNRALMVGTALQVALAVIAALWSWVAQHVLLFGAMLVSATAGYLYAQAVSRGYLASAAGGLAAGGASGLFGAAVSVVLGVSDPGLFVIDILVFAATGAIGGLFGQMTAAAIPERR